MSLPDVRSFRARLLAWFDRYRRDLPWRRYADPYRIWVAEVMLQQTRVDTVCTYYPRFIRRFPTVETLARASLDEVLRYWQGLGYYRRAVHLHAAARKIVCNGPVEWPRTVADWQMLPGVGPYMARAIVSMAFAVPVGVVDGNVRRVLTRLTSARDPRPGQLQAWADTLVDPSRPGDFNQAMMELGATICTPRQPDCAACPVRVFCRAYATGTPERVPVSRKRTPQRVEHWWVLGIESDDRWLLGRRHAGLLQHMWLLPMWPASAGRSVRALRAQCPLLRDLPDRSLVRLPQIRHAFTHRVWIMDPVYVRWIAAEPMDQWDIPEVPDTDTWQWVHRSELARFPIPRAHRKVLETMYHLRDGVFRLG